MKIMKMIVGVLVLVLAVASLSGCSIKEPQAYAKGPDDQGEDVNVGLEMVVVVYRSNSDASELIREEQTVVQSDLAHEVVALQALGWEVGADSDSILSVETRDGIAYVDFAEGAVKRHPGGSSADYMAIYSIVYTLTEFPEIEQVQFLVEGEIVEAVFGHIATDTPIGR